VSTRRRKSAMRNAKFKGMGRLCLNKDNGVKTNTKYTPLRFVENNRYSNQPTE
jgi:hypothetical protein